MPATRLLRRPLALLLLPSVAVCVRLSATPPHHLCARTPPPPHACATTTTPWTELVEGTSERLTDAQCAKTVTSVVSEGVLSTHFDGDGDGLNFNSHVDFFADEQGCPVFLLQSDQAADNLAAAASAGFFARAPRGLAQAGSSVRLTGSVEAYLSDEITDDKLVAMAAQTGLSVEQLAAAAWRRLVPARVHLTDVVRQVEAWVAPSDYADAEANPLAKSTAALLAKVNGKHAADLARFASVYTGAGRVVAAELLLVDQLGFDMRVLSEGAGGAPERTTHRVGLQMPPQNEEEAVSAFMKLFQEAYERENGFLT